MTHATRIPWVTKVTGTRYGTDDTYRMAADWLAPCYNVDDWGGGRGHFQQFLGPAQRYRVIDGTQQTSDSLRWPYVVADLAKFHDEADGILLRHVLEMTEDWAVILENAVQAFQKRMVVVTFTRHVRETRIDRHHLTWPVHVFNHKTDLIPRMEPYLKQVMHIRTTQPERVYFLEK